MSDDSRICAVCGRVLEEWGPRSGPRAGRFYRHSPLDATADHPPVAVRAEEMPEQALYRCDFCLQEPVTHTLVTDVEVEVPEINTVWSTDWAMCSECAGLAIERDWLNLRRRAFTMFIEAFGPLGEETKLGMRLAFRKVADHTVMIYKEA